MRDVEDRRVLYVHGYEGHENGSASNAVRNEIARRGLNIQVDAPEFAVTDPEAMKAALYEYARENKYDCVVASSLGAFYTMQSPIPIKILINTAMPGDLKLIRDADPVGNEKITDEFLAELFIEKEEFLGRGQSEVWKDNTYMIFGTRDVTAHGEGIISPLVDESHIFHVEMAHRMAAVGAAKVCDILEDLFYPI